MPVNCDQCGFRFPADPPLCRRHAPGPVPKDGTTLHRARWPGLPTALRCGEGAADGVLVACGVGNCIHWVAIEYAPTPMPAAIPRTTWEQLATLNEDPDRYQGFGRCTKYTMSPSNETAEMEHRITHGQEDGCGDGALPLEENAGAL